MDDNNLRVVLKIHKRSSLEASPSRTWKAQETSTDPSVPNPKRQRTKAISEEHSIVIPSPPKPDSKGASPPADETVAHPIFSSKRKRQLSDSGITDSRPAEQTISGNENRSSLPLKDGKNPLPEKALCEILDKLQKKDLYGVFSVPVNPAEVPDYFDVISHPMDFSTVRGRVAKKLYTSWRQFEDDVSLIWKNAMIYNAEGTIYYKQAKAMQGMAQKIFPAAGSNEIYPRSGFGRGFRGRGRGRGQPGRPKRIPLSDPAQKDTQSGRRFLGQRKDAVPLVDDKQDRLVFGMDERSEVSLSEDIAQTKPAQRILGKGMEKGELLNSQSQPKSSYLGGDDSGNKVSRLKNYKVCRRATSPSGGKHLSFRSWRQSRSCQTSRSAVPESFALCYSADQDPLAYAHSLARFASPLGSLVWEVAAEKVKQTLPSEVPFGRGWIGLDDPLQSLQSLNHEGESARRVLKGQKEGVPDVSVDDVKQASKQPVRTAAKTSARPAKGLRKSASPHPGSLTKLQVCSEAAAAAPIETAHSKSVSDGAPVSSTSESVHGPKDIDRSSGMLHMPHWFNGASRPGAGFSSPPPTAAVVSPISAQEALSGPRGVSTGSPSEAGSLSLSNAAIQTLLNSCAGAADHVDRSSVLAMRASAVAALQAANSARQGQSVLSAQALQSLMHAPQGSADVETPTKPLGSALMGALNALWSQNASTSSPGAPAITAAAFGKQGLNSLHRLGGLSSPVRAGSTSSSDPGDKNAADHLNKMVEGHHAVFSQNGLKNSPLWAALEAGKIDGLLGSPLNSSKGASVGDGSGAQAVATSNQAAQALAASVSKGSWPGGLPGNAWLAEFSSQQQQAANATAYGSLNALTPATLADVLQQQQGTNPSTSSLRPGSSSAARSMMAALDKLKAHHGLHSNSAGSSFSSAAFSAAAAAASNHASASASAGLPVADGSMAAATGSFANMSSMMSAMTKQLDPRSPPSLQQQRQQQQQLKLAEQQHQQQRQKQLLLLQQQQRLQQQRQEQQQQLLHQQQQQQQQRLQQQRQQLLLRQHQASLLQKQPTQNGAQQQQESQRQQSTPAQQSTPDNRFPQGWLSPQDQQQAFQLLAQAQKNKELAELQANKQMPVWEQQKQQLDDQSGQFQSRSVTSEPELRLQL